MEYKAQGAIEYLLIIAAAIIVVAIVIVAMTGLMGTGQGNIDTAGATVQLNMDIQQCTANCDYDPVTAGQDCTTLVPEKCPVV